MGLYPPPVEDIDIQGVFENICRYSGGVLNYPEEFDLKISADILGG